MDLCESKNILVSNGKDETIALWNLYNGEEIKRFKGLKDMNANNLYTGIFYNNAIFGASSLLLYHKRTQICVMRDPENKNTSSVSICD